VKPSALAVVWRWSHARSSGCGGPGMGGAQRKDGELPRKMLGLWWLSAKKNTDLW